MERNKELFDRVAQKIEDEPDQYNQSVYILKEDDPQATWKDWKRSSENWCGTAACIAGHAIIEGKFNGDFEAALEWENQQPSNAIDVVASALLGIDEKTATNLFDFIWKPHDGLSVPDALRKLGEGADLKDVSSEELW